MAEIHTVSLTRRLAALALLPWLFGSVPALSDLGLTAPEPPDVSAQTWILYDDTFGEVLAEAGADRQRSVASTTKILTALVVIENADLDEKVIISATADAVGESEIGLVGGEPPWQVEDLLAALMLWSANDAAVALAEHVGGSVTRFSDLMNTKVAELGLANSHFVNPHGLDHPEHYSTARDLLHISRAAMDNPVFARLVGTLTFGLPPHPNGENRVAVNRNSLLGTYPGALGIKTGYTGGALQTFSAVAEREGRRVYAVVLGSTDHFADAALLLDYAFEHFTPLTLVPSTSRDRRPLAGDVVTRPGSDSDIFSKRPEDDGEEQPLGQSLQAGSPQGEDTPEEPGEELVGDQEPQPTTPPPAVLSDGEAPPPPLTVARRPELPGIGDAVSWITRFWTG